MDSRGPDRRGLLDEPTGRRHSESTSARRRREEAWAEVRSAVELIELSLALSSLGLRHARIRAEARKTLAALPRHFGRGAEREDVRAFASNIVQLCDFVFEDPEASRARQREIGAARAVRLGMSRPIGDRYRFERESDVPAEIALPLAVNTDDEFLGDIQSVGALFFALPWLSRAKAEDLYLPSDYLAGVSGPWTPERTLHMFRGLMDLRQKAAQQPREGPTRKGPCPCGSGKKYKRCCGQEA